MTSVVFFWLALLASQVSAQAAPTNQPPAAEATLPAATNLTPAERAKRQAAIAATPCDPASATNSLGMKGMTAPVVIYQVEPDVSKDAGKYKISGSGVINLIVDVNGVPTSVRSLPRASDTVDPKLQAAAAKLNESYVGAIKRYRFKPATCNGVKVPVALNMEVNVDFF